MRIALLVAPAYLPALGAGHVWEDDAHVTANGTLRSMAGPGEAVARFERAIALAPTYADAHQSPADVLSQARRWEDARAHYREALRFRTGAPQG